MSGAVVTQVAPRGVELGYAQITALFSTSSTAPVDVPGLTVTVTIGSRPVKVEAGGPYQNGTTAGSTVLLLRASTQIQGAISGLNNSTGACGWYLAARDNPGPGTYTYKVQLASAVGTSTAVLNFMSASAPAWIQVTEV